jgi:hypothetical protein
MAVVSVIAFVHGVRPRKVAGGRGRWLREVDGGGCQVTVPVLMRSSELAAPILQRPDKGTYL